MGQKAFEAQGVDFRRSIEIAFEPAGIVDLALVRRHPITLLHFVETPAGTIHVVQIIRMNVLADALNHEKFLPPKKLTSWYDRNDVVKQIADDRIIRNFQISAAASVELQHHRRMMAQNR